MPTKPIEQRLQTIKEKIEKLDAQKQILESHQKDKNRKERTRRLIQIGAIMENLGINNLEMAEDFKTYFSTNVKSKEWLNNFISNYKTKVV